MNNTDWSKPFSRGMCVREREEKVGNTHTHPRWEMQKRSAHLVTWRKESACLDTSEMRKSNHPPVCERWCSGSSLPRRLRGVPVRLKQLPCGTQQFHLHPHTRTHTINIYICISWSKNLFVPQQQKEFEDNLDNPHGDDWRKEQICAAATQEQKQEKKEKEKKVFCRDQQSWFRGSKSTINSALVNGDNRGRLPVMKSMPRNESQTERCGEREKEREGEERVMKGGTECRNSSCAHSRQ